MTKGGLVPEDRNLPLKPTPWTLEETEALHEMAQEYVWKRRLGKKMSIWGLWLLGIPMMIWTFIEPIDKICKFLRLKLFGG